MNRWMDGNWKGTERGKRDCKSVSQMWMCFPVCQVFIVLRGRGKYPTANNSLNTHTRTLKTIWCLCTFQNTVGTKRRKHMLCEFNSIHETISNSLSQIYVWDIYSGCRINIAWGWHLNISLPMCFHFWMDLSCLGDSAKQIYCQALRLWVASAKEKKMFKNICEPFIMGAVGICFKPFILMEKSLKESAVFTSVQFTVCLLHMSQWDYQYFNLSLKCTIGGKQTSEI